jgi:hypothetical protein
VCALSITSMHVYVPQESTLKNSMKIATKREGEVCEGGHKSQELADGRHTSEWMQKMPGQAEAQARAQFEHESEWIDTPTHK